MTPTFLPPDALDHLPRLGWAAVPSPVQGLPELAAMLGVSWLGAKIDGELPELHGGSKVRKLDFLLAREPWRDAQGWASVGAIGSGHLVACTAAARHFHKRLETHLFWEPISSGVLDNLAFTASGPARLHWHPSRLHLALTAPNVLIGQHLHGLPVIPPGATLPVASLGLVRAGLELAAQVRAGELPEPERIYVALGSGGTVAGLAVGLAMGGLRCRLHAVAAVERALAGKRRIDGLIRGVREVLRQSGLPDVPPVEVVIDHKQVGPGYGIASQASLRAVEELTGHGLACEPIYTGKALAALLDDLRGQQVRGPVLFWSTVRHPGPLPADPEWRQRLPRGLRMRLAAEPEGQGDPQAEAWQRQRSRRRFVTVGLVGLAGLAVAVRTTGYRDLPGWQGQALSAREAWILAAAAEALLPPAPPLPEGWQGVASAIERYLSGTTPKLRREVAALLALVEQGTPLGGYLTRLTRLEPDDRRQALVRLGQHGGLLGDAWRGLRDLVMLGYYAHPASWPDLGYGGPPMPPGPRPRRPAYAQLMAPAGGRPRASMDVGVD